MIIETLAAWAAMTIVLLSGGGWAADLARYYEDRRLLTCVLTPLLSAGALTIIMFWLGLLHITLQPLTILPCFSVVMAVGWILWSRNRRNSNSVVSSPDETTPWQKLIASVVVTIGAAILFNAAYWPFSGDDARLYYWYGIVLRDTQMLFPLNGAATLHEAYPMHMQFLYSFSLMISAWRDEYLARVISTVLSLACLPATYLLGKTLFGRLAGWISLLLLALTPTFADWASTGYVDLPSTAYFSLSAVFAWRMISGGGWRDALLCGLSLGLAAWTKNTALIGVGLLAVALIVMTIRGNVKVQHFVIAGLATASVTLPWYLRNLLEAGMIIPSTAWTDQAQPTANNLLVLITRPELYGFTGVLALLAFGGALFHWARHRTLDLRDGSLLWLCLPYLGVWWWFASYDPRFLLMILPLLVVFAAGWLTQQWQRLPNQPQWLVRAVALVTLLIAGYIFWESIEYKNALLQQPFMTHEEKIAVVRNGERILPNLVDTP